MLGSIVSSSRSALSAEQMLELTNTYLNNARQTQDSHLASIFCDNAEMSLSQAKDAFKRALSPETLADQTLRNKIGIAYFERGEVLDKLGQYDRAQASYKKAQKWGHSSLTSQPSSLSVYAALHPTTLTSRPFVTAQTSEILASAPPPAVNPSSSISADIPSTLVEPAQNAALSPRILEHIQEKNDLVNQLFAEILQTFQNLDLSSVWPSAFLVYAHDNPHYGMADAGTSKFLIDHLVKLGVNLYSDQRPKGLQAPAALSTREDAARVDDILTSQLCLLPTAIGGIQPVDKVIVCGSQVLGHYLQWGEAGKHYQAYCTDLKKAYGLAQQNPAQAEAEIRKVVNTYSQQADFHHVLTEMAFLKIRTDYLDQHGIIPVSLCANGYELCVQDFVKATTVRIEDMPRFASQQASGQAVYQQQGRHLVFFKLLERLLAQHSAEALLRTFWTAYSDLIKRLNSEASAPKAAEYVRVWGQISQNVQTTLQTLRAQVDEHELRAALTHYASLDRLAIQRLSGPPLSMKHCYINLAIVEHQKARKEEDKPKEGDAAQNHFHRLPSFEAIDSNPQRLVPLEKLFDPRELSDGKTVTPQRILIRGRAGVGKTTLSKKIVYDYTQKGQWRDRFDWLFLIPLRTLKGKSSCDLTTLFHETYFQSYPNGQALAKALEAHISGPAKDKTLFVLDGWDEIAQEWGEHELMSNFLKQLLNQPAVLITSRPHVDLKQAQAMDLELETVGFSPKNVTTYLDNRDVMTASDAKEIKHFIQHNAFIQGLVNVPIQLDTLCYSWDEIKRMQKETSGVITVTALYQAMMNKLWRKDMLRLDKREGGELLTESHVNALESPSRIEKLVQAEQDFLSALAFRGLQRNQIEFHHRDLYALIEQLEAQGVNPPITLEANLKKLSFLHTDDAEESQRSYHFMHLTFQEFFAAKHFVQHWEAGREIALLSADAKRWTKATPEAFIRQYQYNPRYEILWGFVAGLSRGEALNRLFILKHCDINLAIVEHKKTRKEEEKPKEGETAQNQFHRLPSFEAIDSNPQKLVPLEKLFDPRELSDSRTLTTQRILIRGRAGVGKTTLSKKIVYEYTQKAQWRDRFHWLFWIQLRTLRGKSSCDLATLFHETYFQSHLNGQALAKALEAHISGPANNKTLFVLDGWDEVAYEWGAHEPMSRFLMQLLNQPAVLITSRPYVDLEQAKPMDLELEMLGLSPENVTAYLDNRDMMTASDAEEMKHFIQANAFIQDLVNVPIQLDALCYSWDEIKRMQKKAPGAMTITALYQAMMNKLWRKDMLCLGKREGGELLTESHVNALSPSRIERLIKAEHNFLSALAFQGLQSSQIEFHQRDLHVLIEQLEAQGVNLPFTLEANLKKLSFLHTDDANEGQRSILAFGGLQRNQIVLYHRELHALIEQLEAQGVNLPLTLEANLKKLSFPHTDDAKESQRSYRFMHLTFQEFFAAKHFVQYWEAGREIALLSTYTKEWTKVTPEAFFRQYKYNPRYEIFWGFVAGLLRGEALNRFFILLEAEPRDLFGTHHQRFIMSCLHEASHAPGVGLLPEIRGQLEQSLAQWLGLEIDKRKKCTLAYQTTFPEHLLLPYLGKTISAQKRRAVATAFEHRFALSESALLALIALTNDKNEDEEVRRSAASALWKQSSLSKSALLALIALTKDWDRDVRRCVADALGRQSSLPESALLALIALTKDEDRDMRRRVADALGRQPSLPESALLVLIALAKDEDRDVRRSAADALGRQSPLPETALLALMALAKDEDGNARRNAADALGRQSSLPKSALLALMALVKDESGDVRRSAANALGEQSSLPESALLALIALVKDESGDVRRSAANALGRQPWLPEPALQALIALTKDGYVNVRRNAADALGEQFSLPESALQALIALVKDENENGDVRHSAANALGRQFSLPESALQALIALAKDEDRDVRRSAADALGRQSPLPETALLALMALVKDENGDVRRSAANALGQQPWLRESVLQALIELTKDGYVSVRRSAADALGRQSPLPESALLALIALLKDRNKYVRSSVTDALGKHHSTFHRLLPTLNRQKIKLIYKEYLLAKRFDQSAPFSFYIQDGTLYFYTAQGLQTVPFGDPDQETEFRQAVQQAQQAAGIPSAPYLSMRDQVEQPGAQNGEEARGAPSISQTQRGPSKMDQSIQTEVFPAATSVN